MDRRMLWAVMLMMAIAFIPSIFIKRPPPPVPVAQVDSTPPVVAGTVTPGSAPAATPAAPGAPGAQGGGVAATPADTVSVTTPLAHYGVSTRGAVLTSLDLVRYKSTAPGTKGQPVELVRPGSPLLGLVVISGSDTLHLDQWDFQVEPRSLSVTSEPASLTLTAERAGHQGASVHLLARRLSGARVRVRHRRGLSRRATGARTGQRPSQHRSRLDREFPRGGARHLWRQRGAAQPGQAHRRRDRRRSAVRSRGPPSSRSTSSQRCWRSTRPVAG